MKQSPQYIKCFLSLVLLLSSLVAMSRNYIFRQIGWSDGLSQITVTAIVEDSLNRIWFGTHNGLNCWNGEQMETFHYDQRDLSTIIEPAVLSLTIHNNELWSRSKIGVSKMNLTTMKIQRFYFAHCSGMTIFRDKLLVSDGNIISYYNESFQLFNSLAIKLPDNVEISTIYALDDSQLFIGCSDGSVYVNNGVETLFLCKYIDSPITVLLKDHTGCLWIGSRDGGLFRYTNGEVNIVQGVSSSIRTIIEDNKGGVWVGSFDGLYNLSSVSGGIVNHYKHSDSDVHSLSNNSVHSLFVDSSETLWIGTYFGGASYIHLDNESYTVYRSCKDSGLSSNIVGHMIEDNSNNLWVATEGGGLNYLDRSKSKFVHFGEYHNGKGLKESNIRYLHSYSENELLISTHGGGLKLYNFKTNESKQLGTTKYPEKIIPFGDNYLVSTRDEGLLLFDVETGEYQNYPMSKDIYKQIGNATIPILLDHEDILWIGTENRGLFAYDTKDDILKRYEFDIADLTSMSNGYITLIVEDSNNRLWVASDGGGLSLYNRKDDNFQNYNMLNSDLPSNAINGVQESHFGNLWISTGDGVTRFDVNNDRFYNYNTLSGFPITELSYNSIYVANDGEVFVGGVDGLVSFYENELANPAMPSMPILSALYLNHNVKFSSSTHPTVCDVDISCAKEITLTSQYNSFELTYSACEYKLPKNKYQYMLEGYDREWINANYNTSALYSNLAPGKYLFKVRSTDTSHTLMSDERVLLIRVKPPFYRAWYAYLLYVIVILSTTLIIIILYIKNRVSGNKLQLEQSDKHRIEVLNRAKSRFFTEISNEYLTPLTIITGSIEDIFSSQLLSVEVRKRLTNVYKNSLRLKKLAGELVDFRKIEHNNLQLKFQEIDIVDYIDGIYLQFKEFAERNKAKLSFVKPADAIYIWIDPWQMEKVVFNSLSDIILAAKSNADVVIAIKPDQRGVSIEMSVSATEESVNRMQDSGVGLGLVRGIIENHKGEFVQNEELSLLKIYLLRGVDHIENDPTVKSAPSVFEYNVDNYKLLDSDEITDNHLHLSDSAPTVLIVEDDNQIKLMLIEALSKRYNLYFTRSDKGGIKLALSIHPDIVLVAYARQAISGVEVCGKIKRNIDTVDIPVIVMATTINEGDQMMSLQAGAVDYIAKPFNLSHLRLKIDNVLSSGVKNMNNSTLHSDSLPAIDRIFLEKLVQVIDAHLGDCDFNIDKFADLMHINRSLFYKRFKQVTGKTPNEMIMERRLDKAAELLSENINANVSEIGLSVGFSSAVYFTQCFKRYFGASPSKYGRRK